MTSVGYFSDDSDHGVANCFLPRSRRSTIPFSLEATVHPLPEVSANEIVPASVVVVAAAFARLLFARGELRPNAAMLAIAPASNSNNDRRGRC
jgi:hypothetical protein